MSNEENGNGRYISQKTLIGILLVIAFSASGLIVADTRSGVTKTREEVQAVAQAKIDKAQYAEDIRELKEGVREIREAMSCVKTAIIAHDKDATKYFRR